MGTKELEKEKKELEKQLNDDESSTNSELKHLEDKIDVESKAVSSANENSPPTNSKNPDYLEDQIKQSLRNFLYDKTLKINTSVGGIKTLLGQRQKNSQQILETSSNAPETFVHDATVVMNSKLNEYTQLKVDLKSKYNYLVLFQSRNNLERPAHYPPSKLFVAGVIMTILLLEAILNGSAFAKEMEEGLLGGGLLAIVIAIINIFFGFMIGKYIITQTSHINLYRRVSSYLVTIFWAIATFLFNLLVAYARDNPEMLKENFDIKEIINDPFKIDSVYGWLLLILGIIFAIVALFDGFESDDHYYGYGRVDRQVKDANQEIVDFVEEWTSSLEILKNSFLRKLKADEMYVHSGKNESESLYSSRDRKIKHFNNLVKSVKGLSNVLIKKYRQTNSKYREDKAPPKFFDTEPIPLDFEIDEFDDINLEDYELDDKNIFSNSKLKITEDYKHLTAKILEKTS